MVKKQTKKKKAKIKKVKPAKKGNKQPVTKAMLIGDIALKYPKAVPLMFKFGMHCIGCGMTAYESLEQGCLAHGMSKEEIDKLVAEINKAVK
jgi:hybrid cluster-associated redox disulfide protein